MRKLLIVAAAAAVLAGCGGSSGSTQSATPGSDSPGGASVAPASTKLLVRLDTAFGSSEWTTVDALLKKFPDGEKLYSSLGGKGVDFERDVKPALGPETDVLALTAADLNKSVFVGLTQPQDQAKLDTLLAKSSPPAVSEQIGDWTVVAQDRATIDRFKQARNGGSLSDSAMFKEANSGLPAAALASAYVDGSVLTSAIDKTAHTGTGPLPGVGQIAWLSAALSAQEQGLAVDVRLKGDQLAAAAAYKPELPAQVPADVSVFVDFKGLDSALQQLTQSPALKQQLGAASQVIGALLGDVIALFKGEGAVYVRTQGTSSEYTLVLQVADEQSARATLDKLAGLLTALGQQAPQTVTVAGVSAKKITIGKTALYYAVFDGKLVLTNAESGIEGLKDGSQRLSDSQGWKDAAAAAGLSDTAAGIFYADVQALVPLIDRLNTGTPLSPQVKRNLAPLGTALLYGSVDGSIVSVKGFLSVK